MEEPGSKVTLKQVMVLLFCGLLSPMIRQVPRQTVEQGEAGGWLGPMLALPVFLLALWLLTACFRRLPRGTGLSGLYEMAFGGVLGKAATAATILWLLVLTGVGLRFYAEDFISSIYLDTDLWLFLVGIMLIVWWVCCRGIATVCRMSQIFFYGLCAIVGLVLALGLSEVEVYHVWPFWLGGWEGVAGAALPVLAVLGQCIPLLYSRDHLSKTQGGLGIAAAWFAALCLVLTVLECIMIGVFGWQTVERMQMPFFSLAKEGSALNVVERLESVVAGVWVFSDVALFSALILAAKEMTKGLVRRVNGGWLITGMSIAVVVLSVWIAPNRFQLRALWRGEIQMGNWVICYLLPFAACLVAMLRQGKRGK